MNDENVRFQSKEENWTKPHRQQMIATHSSMVPKEVKQQEKLAARIYKQSKKAEVELAKLHEMVQDSYQFIHTTQAPDSKGNIEWGNFDKSMVIKHKVEENHEYSLDLYGKCLLILKRMIDVVEREDDKILIKSVVGVDYISEDNISKDLTVEVPQRNMTIFRKLVKLNHEEFNEAYEAFLASKIVKSVKLYTRIYEKIQGSLERIKDSLSNF